MSHRAIWPLIQPPAIICGSVGEKANENTSHGASRNNYNENKVSTIKIKKNFITFGCIGSKKLQISINDGDITDFARLSIRSYNGKLAANDIATIPFNVGCH
jgi:hypothetical protein